MTLSIPGVDLLPCAVVIECYVGPPCTALVSDRVRALALKLQPVCLSLPGRAERVARGHQGATGAQLEVAPSLSGSGIGIWGEMDKRVTADPSLSVLRDGCAEAMVMGLMPEGTELLPLFRRIDRGKKRGQYFRSEGIGYSRMSECVKAALAAIGEDPIRYGLHSSRPGANGATEVASRSDFDPRGLEKHGGWAPNSGSMPGYIEDSAVVAMSVPNLPTL